MTALAKQTKPTGNSNSNISINGRQSFLLAIIVIKTAVKRVFDM